MLRYALPLILAFTTTAIAAEAKYVAVFSTLTTKGTFERLVIESTADGVGLVECNLRKDAWWAERGPMFETMKAALAAKGQHAEFSLACEPKE